MPIDRLILLAEKLPPSWRGRLWNSPVRPVVRRLVDLLFRRHLTIVPLARPLEGHRMRLNWQMQASYGFGTYEPEVVRTVQSVVRPGWVAVDIGANIGYFTLLLAKLVGPRGRVITFEPLPENFRILAENVRLNGYQNVTLEPSAVMERPGCVRLHRPREQFLTGTATTLAGPGASLQVPAVSLDGYLDGRGERVRFVKIDVEGAEGWVLDGMRRILAEDAPIVLVELHDELSEQNPSLMALRRSGYEIRVLARPAGSPVVHVLAERQ